MEVEYDKSTQYVSKSGSDTLLPLHVPLCSQSLALWQ